MRWLASIPLFRRAPVFVQGGYNDVLARRTAPALVVSIEGLVYRISQRHMKVVLCGFYTAGWDAVGRAITRKYGGIFVDGSFCYDSHYTGLDGLHMNTAGHDIVARRLFSVIARLLARPQSAAAMPGR
jgi:hypothetical protein